MNLSVCNSKKIVNRVILYVIAYVSVNLVNAVSSIYLNIK